MPRILVLGMLKYDHPTTSFCEGLRQAGARIADHVPVRGVARYLEDFCGTEGTPKRLAEFVLQTVMETSYDTVLCYHSPFMPPDFVSYLRRKGKRPTFYYQDPYPEVLSAYGMACIPEYSLVLSHGDQIAKEFAEMGARHSVSMPPCLAGTTVFNSPPEAVEKPIDVLVSFNTPYDRFPEVTDRRRLALLCRERFGDQFRHHGKQDKWEAACSEPLSPRKLMRLRWQTKIEINAHARKDAFGYTNHRHFEIPSCGALQLCDRTLGLQYFNEGLEIVYYESPEEAVDKAEYYLEHEEDRAEIARAGLRRCCREWTAKAAAEVYLTELERCED